MTPARRRRLAGIGLILLTVSTATALALTSFNENLLFFYSPSDVSDGKTPDERRFRLGGIVVDDSFRRENGSLQSQFALTDNYGSVTVSYDGILPDLFREGQSIVALGKLDQTGIFRADEVLAKHDENYMPAEVADALARAAERNANTGAELAEQPAVQGSNY